MCIYVCVYKYKYIANFFVLDRADDGFYCETNAFFV